MRVFFWLAEVSISPDIGSGEPQNSIEHFLSFFFVVEHTLPVLLNLMI